MIGKRQAARDLKRRSEIIRELCNLSRDGWANAKPCDYEPLERELRELEKGRSADGR
jgi:hypothetical protein